MKEKDKNTPYWVTEWQWLEVQLKLFSLKHSAKGFSTWFKFPSEDSPQGGKIICAISAMQVQNMLKDKASKKEQLEYYKDWAELARQIVSDQVSALPVLAKNLMSKKI